METRTDFQKTADAAMNLRPARGGPGNAGKNLEKSGFARTIAPDQAQNFTFADLQGDVVERPESIRLLPLKQRPGRAQGTGERVAKKPGGRERAPLVALADAVGFDDGGGHTRSAILPSM